MLYTFCSFLIYPQRHSAFLFAFKLCFVSFFLTCRVLFLILFVIIKVHVWRGNNKGNPNSFCSTNKMHTWNINNKQQQQIMATLRLQQFHEKLCAKQDNKEWKSRQIDLLCFFTKKITRIIFPLWKCNFWSGSRWKTFKTKW